MKPVDIKLNVEIDLMNSKEFVETIKKLVDQAVEEAIQKFLNKKIEC